MPEPKQVRIVLADDHPIFRDGLRRLLEAEPGFKVVAEGSDGAQAIELCRRFQPDLLLLDVTMPNTPGLEALQVLSREGLPTRIILLTAAISKSAMLHALELGARGVIMKDTATQLLLKGIHAVMRGEFWIGRESIADLVQFIRQSSAAEPARKKYGLTPRELEIVSELVNGGTNRDIAQKFSISEETVKRHLSNIYDKIGVSNRLELALFAMSHKLEA